MNQPAYIDLIKTNLQLHASPSDFFKPGDLEKIFEKTVTGQFSKDHPRHMSTFIAGNTDFNYPLPSDWEVDESVVEKIEFPTNEVIPGFLQEHDWGIRRAKTIFHDAPTDTFTLGETITGGTSLAVGTIAAIAARSLEYILVSGTFAANETITGGTSGATAVVSSLAEVKLRLFNHTPTATEFMQLFYTISWTKTTLNTDLPTKKESVFCTLFSAKVAFTISRHFSYKTESTIGADAVAHQIKAETWAKRGGGLMAEYNRSLNKSPSGKPAAASLISDQDNFYSWGNDFLLHPRRRR